MQTKALFADSPAACRAANLSLLAVPFRPFATSLGHAGAMQTEFARQAAHSEVGACLAAIKTLPSQQWWPRGRAALEGQ